MLLTMANSVSARRTSGGGHQPEVVAAQMRAPRVAVTSVPTAAGAAFMVGTGVATAGWVATRPTLAQRLAWGLGVGAVGTLGWLEGHGDFGAAAAGAMVGGFATALLEATGIAQRP